MNLFKLYLKKILYMLLYLGIFVVIYFVGFPVFYSFSNIFKNRIIRGVLLLGVPFIIMLALVFKMRLKNQKLAEDFKLKIDKDKKVLKRELDYIMRFPDFWAEMLLFSTFLLPVLIFVGVTSPAPLYADIMAGIILFIIFEALFFVADFIQWLIVHAIWLKEGKSE